ncbi:hypothetical protein [Microbacterium sp. CJ88]|uniref:hypothetical protein n=1 Tax=Microbacterium sp. CJ88 TaxID=3445672 RepID=UPI003F656F8A
MSERRRATGQREQALLALETATEAVRRAASLFDAVDDFEVEALRAQSTLADVVADSRGDIVAARNAPQVPAVTAAVSALEEALAALSPAGAKADPFRELTRLREANTALDAAIDTARERAARPLPTVEQIRHAVDDADHQLAVARASSPATAAGSAPTPAHGSPRPSDCDSTWRRCPAARTRSSRRCRWHDGPGCWRPKPCSSPSATSTRPVRRIRAAGVRAAAGDAEAAWATRWAASSAVS